MNYQTRKHSYEKWALECWLAKSAVQSKLVLEQSRKIIYDFFRKQVIRVLLVIYFLDKFLFLDFQTQKDFT